MDANHKANASSRVVSAPALKCAHQFAIVWKRPVHLLPRSEALAQTCKNCLPFPGCDARASSEEPLTVAYGILPTRVTPTDATVRSEKNVGLVDGALP